MITGKVSEEDYLGAQYLHLRKKLVRQRITLAVFVIAGALIVLGGHFFAGIVLIGAGGGGLIGRFIDLKLLLPRRLRRLYRQHASFRSELSYS